jgi:hypothetical protein
MYYFNLQGNPTIKLKKLCFFETSVSNYQTARFHNQEDKSNRTDVGSRRD